MRTLWEENRPLLVASILPTSSGAFDSCSAASKNCSIAQESRSEPLQLGRNTRWVVFLSAIRGTQQLQSREHAKRFAPPVRIPLLSSRVARRKWVHLNLDPALRSSPPPSISTFAELLYQVGQSLARTSHADNILRNRHFQLVSNMNGSSGGIVPLWPSNQNLIHKFLT
jgi:hypothetical protein